MTSMKARLRDRLPVFSMASPVKSCIKLLDQVLFFMGHVVCQLKCLGKIFFFSVLSANTIQKHIAE